MDLFREYINGWNSIHERVFSVIICMIFKLMPFKYDEINKILNNLDCLSVKHCLK